MQNAIKFLQNTFKYFLKLSFLKKFFITYVGCWCGFFSMILFSKILYFLFVGNAVSAAGDIASQKFEVISGAVSSYMGYNYLSISLSYFINNSMACTVILLAFSLVAYLYKKDIANNRSSFEDYLNAMILFYTIVVINPLTGIVGYGINIKDILIILPHGIFEFAGFALSAVMGITIADKILPIISGEHKNEKKGKNKKQFINLVDILKIVMIFIFIGIAASLEPLDWLIYEYAKYNNLNIIQAIIEVYKQLIYNIFKI